MKSKSKAIFDDYLLNLVRSFEPLKSRQGSQAFDNFFSAAQYIPAYRWIYKNVPKGSRVLDWGCGNGHFSDFLETHDYKVVPYGFESPGFLQHVGSRAIDRYVEAKTNTELPFQSASFDLVTSIGVLEHVREFGGAEIDSLAEISRVLRPGGTFFCFHFPNRFSWIELASGTVGRWHHRYRFTRRDIELLCRAASIELITCKRYGFLPRNVMRYWPLNSIVKPKSSENFLERADDWLEMFFSVLCQNWMFVGKKR